MSGVPSKKPMSQQQMLDYYKNLLMLDYYKNLKIDEMNQPDQGAEEIEQQLLDYYTIKKDAPETNQPAVKEKLKTKQCSSESTWVADLKDLDLLDRMKVIFLGNSDTGKTSLLHRFTTRKFSPEQATIGLLTEVQIKNVRVGQGRVEVFFWDTAGSERFRTFTLIPMYYRRARGAIVVYDITNKQSFVDIEEKWMHEMGAHCPKIPIILLGNKLDLNSERQVSIAEGMALAKKYGMLFMETSAKTSSIEYAVAELIIEMMNKPTDLPEVGHTIKPGRSISKTPKNKKCC